MNNCKRTPIYDEHVAAGARMVSFAGFEMPVSYSGIIEEHTAVRERAGIFDVSHMGEFLVSGRDTWVFLNSVVTNDCGKLDDGGVLYTVMCKPDGTVVDDLLVMRLGREKAIIVANAANIEKDFAHIKTLQSGEVEVTDVSDGYALLALQGPQSREVLKACQLLSRTRDQLDSVEYYRHFQAQAGGVEIIVSRTGYTGELGFEIFVPPDRGPEFWSALVEAGAKVGMLPIGLAARDTLRFEAAFCLYGHELDEETSPLEAGLGWVVKLKKGDFCGRSSLLAEKDAGSARRLVGFELEGRNIARQGYEVVRKGSVVGRVTSGTFSPTLQKSLCMAYVQSDALADGSAEFGIQVRQKVVAAIRVELPFYPSRARTG